MKGGLAAAHLQGVSAAESVCRNDIANLNGQSVCVRIGNTSRDAFNLRLLKETANGRHGNSSV